MSTHSASDHLSGEADPIPSDDARMTIGQLMLQFQSVGDNCEFGVVQRYCGVEPSGLFRFSTSGIQELIDALNEDFASYGAPGDLEIIPGTGNFYWCRSRRYGFGRSSNQTVGTVDPAELLAREYDKVAHLKTRLLKELAAGQQIVVRKGDTGETRDQFLQLAAAIRRHGPARVMRVEVATAPETIGTAEWHAPGILFAYVRRFSPYDGGMRIDLEPWIDLCRDAHALATSGRPALAREGTSTPIRLQDKAARHVTKRSPTRFTSFRTSLDPGAYRRDAISVFSAWVWIPSGFRAEAVFVLVKASDVYLRLANRDADLGLRDAWQRIWISAQLPDGSSSLVVGLGVTGEAGQRFWSTDWRANQGPVPPPAAPPSVPIRRGLLDWLAG